MENIAKALIKAQSNMGNANKGATNPFFKSKYADLNAVREAVLPALNECNIAVLQPIEHIDGKNFVKTMLLHESGESIESYTEIMYSKQNDAQAQGSGISYARRYGLQSMLCIGAEDDDAQKAVKQTSKSTEIKKEDLTFEQAVAKLNSSIDLDMLKSNFLTLKPEMQKATEKVKNEIKDKLTNNK